MFASFAIGDRQCWRRRRGRWLWHRVSKPWTHPWITAPAVWCLCLTCAWQVQRARHEPEWDLEQVKDLMARVTDNPKAEYLTLLDFSLLLDDPWNFVFDPVKRLLGCGEDPAE